MPRSQFESRLKGLLRENFGCTVILELLHKAEVSMKKQNMISVVILVILVSLFKLCFSSDAVASNGQANQGQAFN